MSFPSPATTQPSPNNPPTPSAKTSRGHSCILCRRRKVKCDGHHPCSNCIKSRAKCEAPEVVPARRRKRRAEDLVDRLRKLEEIVAKHGIKTEEDDEGMDVDDGSEAGRENRSMSRDHGRPDSASNAPTGHRERGRVVVSGQSTRYIDNSFWESINTEVGEEALKRQGQAHSDEDSDDQIRADPTSLIFGRLMLNSTLTSAHPTAVQIFRLWQLFLDNINALTKIIHAPTVQQMILQGIGDLSKLSAADESLLFVIYLSAIASIDEEECYNIMSENKSIIMTRFTNASMQSLCNAKLLKTTNFTVLQAYTLYLLAINRSTQTDVLWSLAGIALRIAQRMGLDHLPPAISSASTSQPTSVYPQDSNPSPSTPKLPILEAEFRRRTWWQLLALEGHLSFLSGQSTISLPLTLSTQILFPLSSIADDIKDEAIFKPTVTTTILLNLSDASIPHPPATSLPPALTPTLFSSKPSPPTEMLFTCLRQNIGIAMYTQSLSAPPATPAAIDTTIANINAFEASLKQTYLGWLDENVPLHVLSKTMARSAVGKLRLRVYAPHRRQGKRKIGAGLEKRHLDAAFQVSCDVMRVDIETHQPAREKMLKGFQWHIRVFFQLEAFVFVFGELRQRALDRIERKMGEAEPEEEKEAWGLLEECFKNHPEVLGGKKELWWAVGNLCLKTWEIRIKSGAAAPETVPGFVQELCRQRGKQQIFQTEAPKYASRTVDMETNADQMGNNTSATLQAAPTGNASNILPMGVGLMNPQQKPLENTAPYNIDGTWSGSGSGIAAAGVGVSANEYAMEAPSMCMTTGDNGFGFVGDGFIGDGSGGMDWEYWQALFQESNVPLFT